MTDRDARVVWTAVYRPYGEAYVDDDPDGDGTLVTSNLRYPGQYEDTIEDFPEGERLYYNVMRYYDPGLGRYVAWENLRNATLWHENSDIVQHIIMISLYRTSHSPSPEASISNRTLLYSMRQLANRVLLSRNSFVSLTNRNTYSYANNSPLLVIDPLGMDSLFFSGSTLYWIQNDGSVLGTWSAVSGPYGNGAAPPGIYDVLPAGDVNSSTNPSNYNRFCDPDDNCWFARIRPAFSTTRKGLGIHPDAPPPGTLGCIGIQTPNTAVLRDLLSFLYDVELFGPLRLFVYYSPWIRLP